MHVEIKEQDSKGAATATENEQQAGEMTYSIASNDFIIIDHTEVNPEFKGKGVGKQLLYTIVEMAREKNLKILPLCPFASAMFKKFEDLKDVLKS